MAVSKQILNKKPPRNGVCELAGTRTQGPPDKNRDALPTELSNQCNNIFP